MTRGELSRFILNLLSRAPLHFAFVRSTNGAERILTSYHVVLVVLLDLRFGIFEPHTEISSIIHFFLGAGEGIISLIHQSVYISGTPLSFSNTLYPLPWVIKNCVYHRDLSLLPPTDLRPDCPNPSFRTLKHRSTD